MKQHHPENGRAPPGRALTARLLSITAAILISCVNLTPAYSQTPLGFITPGTPCDLAGASAAPNWDSIMQCNSSLVWQRAALQLGSTSDACNAAAAGKIQWTGTLFQGCNGTSWTSFGSGSAGAAGANTQIQFNNAGAFGASSNLVWDNANTRAGIGTASPAATLHVNGETIIGKTSLSCSATTKGALRYDTVANAWTYCNGSAWVPFESAGACAPCNDAAPASFSFTDVTGAAVSTLTTSNIVQVTGFNCSPLITSISGTGSPAYRVCSDSACNTVLQNWTTGASSIAVGQYAQLRLTSSATVGAANSATLVVGMTTIAPWSVQTTCIGGTPAVGTVCDDGTVYAGITPDGNKAMYVTRCDMGQSWNGSACTGTRAYPDWTWLTTYRGLINANTGDTNTSSWASYGATHTAALYCNNLTQDGHSDWYVPAFNELAVICAGRAAIGNFDTFLPRYWSSTEFNNTREKGYHFSSCTWSNMDADWEKDVTGKNMLRCARHD